MVLTGVLSLLVVVVIRTASIAIDLGETGYYDEPLARLVLGARLLSEMDDDHYKEDTSFSCCWGGNASPSASLTNEVEG